MPSSPRAWTTQGAAETQALGRALAAAIHPPLVLALRGNLGAGKTTFVQGLAAGLGVRSRVSSPTFVLVNEYQGAGAARLVHVDTYRMGAAAQTEAAGLGLEDWFEDEDAVVAVEWADHIADLLPSDHLLVELEYGMGEDERRISISAFGPLSAAVLGKIDF